MVGALCAGRSPTSRRTSCSLALPHAVGAAAAPQTPGLMGSVRGLDAATVADGGVVLAVLADELGRPSRRGRLLSAQGRDVGPTSAVLVA
jgi:hypothetical protein